jgi:hypothetical protein
LEDIPLFWRGEPRPGARVRYAGCACRALVHRCGSQSPECGTGSRPPVPCGGGGARCQAAVVLGEWGASYLCGRPGSLLGRSSGRCGCIGSRDPGEDRRHCRRRFRVGKRPAAAQCHACLLDKVAEASVKEGGLAISRGHQSATAGGGRTACPGHPPRSRTPPVKDAGVCGAGRCRSARSSGTGGVVAERQAAAAATARAALRACVRDDAGPD